MFDKVVATEVATVVEDLGEEVVVCSIVHDDVSIIEIFDDTVEGNDVRVSASYLVKRYLPDVNMPLAHGVLPVYEAFHRV